MKIKIALICLILTGCETTSGRTGYLITTYDESGEVAETYFVQKYSLTGDKIVVYLPEGEKEISGSAKIERIK